MVRGRCTEVPTAVFFPVDGGGVGAAARICDGCEVRRECLDYALANRISYGVWGGASERERHRLLRERTHPGRAAGTHRARRIA
jgi:WhiB family redox-sensing transcriptional regulator